MQLPRSWFSVVDSVSIQLFVDLIFVDYLIRMPIDGCLDGMQMQPWNAFDKHYLEYAFSMANDLLDDNGCLAFLQSFDDASTMELFSFTRVVRFLSLPKSIHASTTSLCTLNQERYYMLALSLNSFF